MEIATIAIVLVVGLAFALGCIGLVSRSYNSGPATMFHVAARYGGRARQGWLEGGGAGRAVLTISPGSIVLKYGQTVHWNSLNAVPPSLEHRDSAVTLVCALVPPWCNTCLELTDANGTGVVYAPGWKRNALRRALRDAGFAVNEVRYEGMVASVAHELSIERAIHRERHARKVDDRQP